MKELVKVVAKRLFIYSIIINTIYSIADYGESFALSYFGTSPLTLDKILGLTICIIIVDLIMLISGKIASYIDTVNETKSKTAIQTYYFNKVQTMTMEKLTNTHTGYLHTLINEVSDLFFDMIWQFEASFIPLVIGGISIFIMVCQQSIWTGLICIIICALAVTLKYKMMKDKQVYDKEVRKERSRYHATFIDFVQNIVAVRKLSIGRFCNEKIKESSDQYLAATKENEKKRSNMNGVFTGLMDLLYVVVLISTFIMVKNGQDGLPYLLFYMSALGKLYSNLNGFVRLLDITVRFKGAKEQLDEFFKGAEETKLVKSFKKIGLYDTIFSYTPHSTKIKIPEFILKKGDKISIVGESGQGKTTTMNILAGLYPLKNGKLMINGKEEKNKRLDVVFVSQEIELFDLSIRDNLCLGKKIKDDKIIQLLKEAGLEDWYHELPHGLDTMCGEKGVKLSAGQKQRLNLIRGILIDKEVYFLDEPTSNLDSLSEEKMIQMIDKYLKNKTYVIVTHRPKLVELCNKHYVFEHHMMKEIINNG